MASLSSLPSAGAAQRLDTGLLLRAYSAGLFPMADTREAEDVFWVEPRRRGILPLQDFHLSRSLAKVLKQERFRHSCDNAFESVIAECAAATADRQQSWINASIEDAYCRLHAEGHAHSIETWDREGRLVGGLYGVRIGAAFFGESMFSRATDASKAALAHLVVRLRVGGFRLLDTQFLTAHLASFGGVEVKRTQYLAMLNAATSHPADWRLLDHLQETQRYSDGGEGAAAAGLRAGRFDGEAGGLGPSGKCIAQLLSQTS
ncbi:leucyl/phenylalanyl-tRNA--protein transferase [Sandaracinobacteroides hominis]|uniref:leucyl/phenylalanyl-tRNA--protein transferase n=1 Tax=Sandaracinobacteroides hominis TaxID=2780086 RepID=UPI0018F3076C|nr:leucyl/phenylalanyl-tRNA--protein transferase [Sandaracinobacteroides hominis]